MKTIKFVMMIAVVALFAACGGGAKTPAAIEKQIWDQIKSGNYEKAVEVMFANAVDVDKKVDEKEMKAAITMFSSKIEAGLQEKGGIKDVKILSEDIDEEAGTAKVEVEVTFKDGTSETKSDNFKKVDGVWKIKM